jgi:hypothetical protein
LGITRYDIIEETFQPEKYASSELSILTGVDSSSYLVVDQDRQVLGVRAFTHNPLGNWWEQDKYLQHPYQKIRMAWLGRKYTLIPTRLYHADDRRKYLSDLTPLSADEIVLADAIPALNLVLVYALSQNQLSIWRRNFVGCRFYHVLSPLLQQLARQTSRLGLPRMYTYVRDRHLFIIGIDRNKLQFCNAFLCHSAKDYLYYLLLAYEQCGWETNKVPLRLFGEVVSDSEIYKLFYRYVRDVEFLKEDLFLKWGKKSSEQPSHLFYDLAALHSHQ